MAKYVDNRLIVSVVFQVKMSNICWFELFKYEDLLLFFIIYESKFRVFGFWTVV